MDVKADETVLGDGGKLDIEKIKPLIFSPENPSYYGLGKYLGKAFSIGKEITSRFT